MNRLSYFLLAVPLLAALQVTAHADMSRPNIVIIMCDNLGYADVGFSGSTDIQTPRTRRRNDPCWQRA